MESETVVDELTNQDDERSRTVLDVDQINTYYGESHVLQDVSISVGESEVAAILGRNGVGKTTLIRSIIGTVPPRSGHITFNNQDITTLPSHARSRLGLSLVPQARRILPNLTVSENLKVATVASNNEGWSVDGVYELFPRLEERSDQYGYSLSGGEQQMLAIARALVQKTELLLLDEPFEGLAPKIVDDIYDRLESISEEDISVVLVGQNIEETLRLANRAYIINNGQVVHEDEADVLADDTEVISRWLAV